MKHTVSILGCGWLGFPLALRLIQSGAKVYGSTTTPSKINDLKKSGIEPFLIDLNQKSFSIDERFFNSEILFINIPFRRDFQNPFEYCEQLEKVLKPMRLSPIRSVLFASSTSVYPSNVLNAREDVPFIPDNERSQALFKAESLFSGDNSFNAIILRMAGLCGYDRKIGRFLSGQTDLKNADAPVNLIHRDDCLEIILKLMSKDIKGETFNLCCDGHPTRKELYVQASESAGLKAPVFLEEQVQNHKIVSNQKVKSLLKYVFKYPHPFNFLN